MNDAPKDYYTEYSEWVCYIFGSSEGNGLCFRPVKGEIPNWFWRKMQWLCFGNRWVKDEVQHPTE